MKTLFGCFCSALLGGVFAVWMTQGGFGEPLAAQVDAPPQPPRLLVPKEQPNAPRVENLFSQDGLTTGETIDVSVYELCNRSAVNITTRGVRENGLFLMETPEEGSGSGVVIDRAGHVLTNYHVIEDARQVAVTLFDGQAYDAKFIGADPINDLAILKVDAPKNVLFPITLGDSSNLRVGMRVYAIGNPFGLERTMTTGIISSLNRSLQVRGNRSIRSIIQIDAAINPGNSGGPLLNARGQLIGLNTAIASRIGQSAGVGFAIPVNLAKRVVPQLIEHGRVIRADAGIQRVFETDEGLLVAQLTPDGPAEKAGLQGPKITRSRRGVFIVERIDRGAADLIVAVDGQAVKSTDEFLSYVENKKVGETVKLTVIREGRRVEVPVTLGASE